MATPYAGGGLVIMGDGSLQPQVDSLEDLKTRACRPMGGENDDEAKLVAFEGMRRCIDELNIRHHYDFCIETQTDFALVADQSDYDLDPDVFAIKRVQLVRADGSTNEGPYETLEFFDWDQLLAVERDQRQTGTPVYWSARDIHTERELLFYPIPNTAAASRDKVRVTYYTRIQQLVDDRTAIIAGPRELSELLLTYAEFHVLFTLRGEDVARWSFKKNQWREQLAAFKGSRERSIKGPTQMRVAHAGRFLRPASFRR